MTALRSTGDQLCGFIDDLDASLNYMPEGEFGFKNIILCGMGGSAISGDVVADCCYTRSEIPIRVHKSPVLPEWVDESTLAIVSSYSGNTIETLQMYEQAHDRGCGVYVITSGGLLETKAREAGDRLILLPRDMHPRHSVGYMIGYTLRIVNAAGGPDLRNEIRAFIPALKEYRRTMEGRSDSCLAWSLANDFITKVPVICSDISMKSVVLRWKTQINENAKYVAFCGTFPEFKYCCLDTWAATDRDNLLLTLLSGRDDEMCEGTGLITGAASRMHIDGQDFRFVKLMGSSTMENIFRSIILGDYISLYMAELRGIDSADVRPVRQLKEKIKTMLENTEGAS